MLPERYPNGSPQEVAILDRPASFFARESIPPRSGLSAARLPGGQANDEGRHMRPPQREGWLTQFHRPSRLDSREPHPRQRKPPPPAWNPADFRAEGLEQGSLFARLEQAA